MIKSVIKRDGRAAPDDQSKITAAIMKALEAAQEGDAAEADRIAARAARQLEMDRGEEVPQIEQIQDAVETALMETGHDAAAKQYILYLANRTRIREANTSLDENHRRDHQCGRPRQRHEARQRQHRRRQHRHGQHAADRHRRRQRL